VVKIKAGRERGEGETEKKKNVAVGTHKAKRLDIWTRK